MNLNLPIESFLSVLPEVMRTTWLRRLRIKIYGASL